MATGTTSGQPLAGRRSDQGNSVRLPARHAAGSAHGSLGCGHSPAQDGLAQVNAALQAGEADKALALLEFPSPAGGGFGRGAQSALPRALHAGAVGSRQPECEQAVNLDAQNSNYHLWYGRTLGEVADRATFLSAYGLAKHARAEFEQAVQLESAQRRGPGGSGRVLQLSAGSGGRRHGQGGEGCRSAGPSRSGAGARVAQRHRPPEQGSRNRGAGVQGRPSRPAPIPPFSGCGWPASTARSSAGRRWRMRVQSGFAAAQRDPHAGVALFNGASVLIKANRNPALAIKMLEAYLAAPSSNRRSAGICSPRVARAASCTERRRGGRPPRARSGPCAGTGIQAGPGSEALSGPLHLKTNPRTRAVRALHGCCFHGCALACARVCFAHRFRWPPWWIWRSATAARSASPRPTSARRRPCCRRRKDAYDSHRCLRDRASAFPEVGFTGTPPSIWTRPCSRWSSAFRKSTTSLRRGWGCRPPRSSLKDAREQVALDASTAYIELDTVNQELEAARQQEGFAKRLVEIEQQRTEAGVDPLSELLQARLTAANIKLKRDAPGRPRRHIWPSSLSTLTGLPTGSITPDHASIPEIPAGPRPSEPHDPGGN